MSMDGELFHFLQVGLQASLYRVQRASLASELHQPASGSPGVLLLWYTGLDLHLPHIFSHLY